LYISSSLIEGSALTTSSKSSSGKIITFCVVSSIGRSESVLCITCVAGIIASDKTISSHSNVCTNVNWDIKFKWLMNFIKNGLFWKIWDLIFLSGTIFWPNLLYLTCRHNLNYQSLIFLRTKKLTQTLINLYKNELNNKYKYKI
jgi:hypothetical protein